MNEVPLDGNEVGCRRSKRIRNTRRLQSPQLTGVTNRQRRTKAKPSSFERQLKATLTLTSEWRPDPNLNIAASRPTEIALEGRKEAYLQESKAFATDLARKSNDPDAERLYCPVFKRSGCGCIQKYVESDERTESEERVYALLHLIKEAKRLCYQKCYDTNDKGKVSRRQRNIGLGNGQKKSKAFEEFVLENRDRLRHQFHFCERATQKILIYSNNFLHKRLKTVPERGSRARRLKGRAVLGLLPPIERLASERCCSSNCGSLAATHPRLVLNWRQRVTFGQGEARRVLAEMLTPSGGTRTNCYNFISMVTGCSNSTISKVSEQMKRTGGDREPPEHGLKRWHKKNPRSEKGTIPGDEAFSESEGESNPVGTRSGSRHSSYVRPTADLLTNIRLDAGELRSVTFNVPFVDRPTLTQENEEVYGRDVTTSRVTNDEGGFRSTL